MRVKFFSYLSPEAQTKPNTALEQTSSKAICESQSLTEAAQLDRYAKQESPLRLSDLIRDWASENVFLS